MADGTKSNSLPAPSPLRADEMLYKLARGDMVKIKIAALQKNRRENLPENEVHTTVHEEAESKEPTQKEVFFNHKIKRLSDQLQSSLSLKSKDDGGINGETTGTSRGETKRKITF